MTKKMDIDELADLAWATYQAESDQRAVDREQEEVRYNEHTVRIPRSMSGRATKVYSGLGDEKLSLAISVLNDPDGPNVTVARTGTTAKADADREVMQDWFTGGISANSERGERHLPTALLDDQLHYGRAWARVYPAAGAWEGMPGADAQESVSRVLEEYDDEGEQKRVATSRAGQVVAAQAQFKLRRFPILVDWTPSPGVYPGWDTWGLRRIIELQEMSADSVLASFRDENDKPLAKKLKETLKKAHYIAADGTPLSLTGNEVVTVCTYADRGRVVVGIVGLLVDEGAEGIPTRQHVDVRELLYDRQHGMTEVPYAYFPGRMTGSRNPRRKYNPFLKPARDLIIAYDTLLTQLLSAVRMVAWPSLVLYKNPDAQGTGDRPAKIRLVEGDVYAGLWSGDKIENPAWTNSSDFRLLFEAAQELLRRINDCTINPTAGGAAGGADSGYMLAQMDAGTQVRLEPVQTGNERGWRQVCRLMQLAALSLMDEGFADIPVRHVAKSDERAITLTPELAARDWTIMVQIRSRPPGGEMAQAQTVKFLEDAGYIDHATAQERLGIRNPQRMLEGQLQDQVLKSPDTLKLITAAANDRALASLQQALAPKQPQNPLMPAAAAMALQTPEALARLPEGMSPGPTGIGSPAGGGLPNPDAGNPAPPPPALTEQMAARVHGGSVPGQAQAMPGGLARQDLIGAGGLR